jgi:AraC family transcriptional regulator, positive regulator of tynA and feaB
MENAKVGSFSPTQIQSVLTSSLYLLDYQVIANKSSSMTGFDSAQLGAVDVFRYDGSGTRCATRRSHHIQTDKVDNYVICLPLRGRANILQAGTTTDIIPGQFAILSSAIPFQSSAIAAGQEDYFTCYQANIVACQLREKVPGIDKYCDQTIQIRRGASSAMLSLFDLSLKDGNYLPESQILQLSDLLVDVIANSLLEAPELQTQHSLLRMSAKARILEKAKAFIQSNLSNPELDITMIADHCHVSVRSLQKAFATSGLTISAYIQDGRLYRCRSELQSLSLHDKSVTQIAMFWGFNSISYFSQAYKKRFGVNPSEDRKLSATC